MYIGEANAHYNIEQYACSFSKMIYYWREIWHERTNGTTDVQFPFGFVQVNSLFQIIFIIIFINKLKGKRRFFICSYPPMRILLEYLTLILCFVGTKHLMWVMFPIMLFQKYLWLLHVIYAMIQISQLINDSIRLELFLILEFILELNMMLATDFHVLVWQLLMDKKSNFKVLLYKMSNIHPVVKHLMLLTPLSQVLNYAIQVDLMFETILSYTIQTI